MIVRGAGGGGGGKGGGGGSSRAAVEQPDSLRSRQYAMVLDCIAEGEIEGLVDGARGIYLDDTPLMTADGSYNFTGAIWIERRGTPAQSYIPGFAETQSEIAVATEVKAASAVVRAITNANVNAVRVTVSVPQLTYQDMSNGDISGTSVQIAIDVQTAGAGYVERLVDTISGKTTSRYQRSYRIDLAGGGPWDIRVRRLTPDSDKSNLQNRTFWDSYTEIVDVKIRYLNSALVGLRMDASQFRAVPRRGYDIRGLRVRVPTNYDPVARTYSGVWDGTFKIAWTDNPAWCFYDLLTSDRYGLGGYIDVAQIDKWALYEIGRYCDELVPDGLGGMEPRYTCNLYLQARQEAFAVLSQMASIFRGMLWWSNGLLTATQDAPSDPVALFTRANVIDGMFDYAGSSAKQRHTVALVTWNDPADMYRQKIEYVSDDEGIARYGVRETEIVAIGCTSRGQAHRVGRWLLYTERMETETITFRAGLEGVYLFPGAVIRVQDAARAGKRFGGRIVSATTTSVTLDAPVTIETGKSHQLSVVLPDGRVETQQVTAPPGTVDMLTVSSPYSTTPQPQSIWVLAASDLVSTTWRVVAVREVEPTIVEVTALAHRPDKYDAIEHDLVLQPLPVTAYPVAISAPTNLRVTESLYLITPALVGVRATVSWDSVPYAVRYELSWSDGIVSGSVETTEPSYDIDSIQPGRYDFTVRAVDSIERRSPPATITRQIHGKTAPPADVSGLQLAAISGQALLTFDPSPDLDVVVGGHMRVRHSPAMSGAAWDSAVDIATAIPGSATQATLPLLSGTYLAKWVDSSGNESVNTMSVTTSAPDVIALNVAEEWIAVPDWNGTHDHTVVIDGALMLDSSETVGAQTSNITTWPKLSLLGGVASFGEWMSDDIIDIGRVATCRLTATLAVAQFDAADTIGARTDMVSLWPSISGANVSDVAVRLWVSTSDDGIAWSGWQPFMVADWTARYFRFRVTLESASSMHNARVSTCQVTVDMPDLIQQGQNIASGTGTYHVSFAQPFHMLKALAITAESLLPGDHHEIANRSATGFDITFRDAGGVPVSRTFDYIAKGY